MYRLKENPIRTILGSAAAASALTLAVVSCTAPHPSEHSGSTAAVEVNGTLGLSGATTTISGKQLPAPDPKFGGVIKDGVLQSKTWWAPRIVPAKTRPAVRSMPNQKQIVVVDDDAAMKQAIERLLNAAGFPTLTFSSAEALLLESKAALSAACLILDVNLPGLSGFELYQRLSQRGADRPVIFISAYDEPGSLRRTKTGGAIAFITKPFQGQNLIAAINRALGGKPCDP